MNKLYHLITLEILVVFSKPVTNTINFGLKGWNSNTTLSIMISESWGGGGGGGLGLVFKFNSQYLNGASFLGLARTFTLLNFDMPIAILL